MQVQGCIHSQMSLHMIAILFIEMNSQGKSLALMANGLFAPWAMFPFFSLIPVKSLQNLFAKNSV